jgi:hypothetical protein
MPNLNITNIPAPRVPFIDERTGLMAREWYRFFLNLFVLTGSGNNPITLEELQIGPPNQPDLAELLIQINQNIAPQYEDQSGDFLATLDTAQLMSMMARFENAEAAIQGAYLQPVVQTGTIANYNLDGSPTAGGVAYGTGPALAVSAAGTLGQVLTSGGAGAPTWATDAGGTVTSVGFTGGIVTVATPTTTPAFTIAGTSGGIPYFSSASTWASSAALAAGSLVLGGGAGATPATTATGTGVVTALGVNTGTAGAFVVNGGALGTPSSGTVTNLTGTASININGTVGATTAATGAFTTLSATGVATFSAGTVALPSITTSGDTNTGIYFPAADTVGISAGGTQRGAFSSAGLRITGSVGQGVAPTAEYGYRMVFVGATATTQYGFFIDALNNSAGTSGIVAIRVRARTSAAAYTSSVATGLVVEGAAAGAGSTITSAYGIQVQDQTVGTNNYGIQLLVSSGTNKYNIYASGTAQNYFAGTVGIGTASPNASAILDAQSTTKGVRMPNMTTVQKNAIAAPAAGLMVYDTTLAKLCVYTTAWETITSV